MVRWILVGLVIVGGAGWLGLLHVSGGPIVRVVNDSPAAMAGVTVTTSGGVAHFGSLEVGEARCCPVRVRGESSLLLSFTVGAEERTTNEMSYLESTGGYCEVLRVGSRFEVSSEWNGSGCGFVHASVCRLTRRCS